MINPELLTLLRCPLSPTQEATLVEDEGRLVCQRCRLAFPIRDGFPVLIVEEATLPPGCSSLDQLPCQREKSS
jgi:uncharacterized protein